MSRLDVQANTEETLEETRAGNQGEIRAIMPEANGDDGFSGSSREGLKEIKRKAAYVATVYSHLAAFHLPVMEDLRQAGYEVHAYAAPDGRREKVEEAGFECRDVPFSRNPASPGNVKALYRMYRFLRQEGYEFVHVHTPNAGFLTRLAAFFAGTRDVYYTAHGFHFYKGAPLVNWLVYYPFERLAARWTDVLITINVEDFERASRFKVRGRAVQLPGVGAEDSCSRELSPTERDTLYRELGIPSEAFILLCMAELNGNKNQTQLLHAVQKLAQSGVPVCCLFAGEGSCEMRYRKLAEELGIGANVRFLGFRTDGSRLMALSDVVVLLSKREGLPKVLLEALSAGKPAVVTDIRGCRDLVAQGSNGFRVGVGDVATTVRALSLLYRNPELRQGMGADSRSRFAAYQLDLVRNLVKGLYQNGGKKAVNLAANRAVVTGESSKDSFGIREEQRPMESGGQLAAVRAWKVPDSGDFSWIEAVQKQTGKEGEQA